MNAQLRRAVIAALFMVLAAGLAQWMTPTRKLAEVRGRVDLEVLIPKQFGDWRIDPLAGTGGVINPQTEEVLNRLYSQTLSRTYMNSHGDRVMLSIAYGEDQRDKTTQMHYPEVCYPAQGFELKAKRVDTLVLPQGSIPVRRLELVLNRQRYEPVTYWTVIGEQATLGGVAKKLAELRYGLNGEIADGLLFRVSSIDRDSAAAFSLQQRFVVDLLSTVPSSDRKRLSGLS